MTLTKAQLAILAAIGPRPIRECVEGAPHQPGDRIVVVAVADSTADPEHIGKRGRVDYLEYSCGSGQTFPGDPMIGVAFDDGGAEEFWREELAPGPAGAAS